jgi:predicted RND superfamily exporter protein
MLLRYTNWLIQHHKWIVLLSLLLVIAFGFGAKNLTSTSDFRAYFSEDNPQLVAFETLEKTYGKQDSLLFFIQPKDKNIFSKKSLNLILELTDKSWDLPYATRVNSLTNYQHTAVNGDDLATDYLLDDPALLTDKKIAHIKKVVLNEPSLINLISDKKGQVTSIQVRLNLPHEKSKANGEVVSAARELRNDFEQRYPNIKINIGGSAAAGVSLGEAVALDMSTLVVLSYVIIILILLALLRSLRGMLATLLLITFSIVITMGIYGWFNYTLAPVAGWVPSIIMTIAVADSVHILISYFHSIRHGMNQHDALRESMRINLNPVFVTSLTTIIGVLCLNFSDSPPFRDLGNMVALGVFIAFILSMTFLPAFITWLSIGKSHINRSKNVWMDNFANWIILNRKKLLIFMSVFTLAVMSFIPNNQLTEQWHNYFDKTFEIRNTIDGINEKLSGAHYLRYLINSGEENGIHNPEYLNTIENFGNWLRQQDKVAYVSTLSDISKRLNKTLHEDKPEWYRVPDNRQLAAQLFLLYETGLPRELNLDDLVNHNRSSTLVTIIVHKTDSEFLLDLDRRAQGWLKQNAEKYHTGEATGLDMVFAHINHRNIRSLLKGTLVALVLISFVLIIALRSVRLGLISLIPNLVPAALAYGTWGFFVGKIDLSASIVICMSLGIVVDDTVHFLSKYLRARREKNYDVNEGMRYAFNTVGVALLITTTVLVSGFLVLATSHFSPTWVSGLLLAITLSYALLADFLLLPPLLSVLDSKLYNNKTKLKNGLTTNA